VPESGSIAWRRRGDRADAVARAKRRTRLIAHDPSGAWASQAGDHPCRPAGGRALAAEIVTSARAVVRRGRRRRRMRQPIVSGTGLASSPRPQATL